MKKIEAVHADSKARTPRGAISSGLQKPGGRGPWKLALYLFLLAVLTLGGANRAVAQEYFGKNKVNYGGYNWRYITTKHFTIYFDKSSLPVAEFTAREAERALLKIEKAVKYTLHAHVPIVLYNSHNGFAETNVNPSNEEISEFEGGFTEFAQNRVVIPYQGSYGQLRHVIHHELTHAVTVEEWTGGGGLETLMNVPGAMPPIWVVEGLAEYLSLGWDVDADNLMRDATITGYVPPIDQINGGLFAYKGGQSIFNMMADTYGKDKVADFVSALHTTRNADKALKTSIGIGLKKLNSEWHLWLKRQYWNDINLHDEPEEVYHTLINHEDDHSIYNLGPSFSPQSDKIAYYTDKRGYTDIYLISAIDGKPLGRLLEGDRSSAFESLFLLRPGISWSPDGKEIAFCAKSGIRNTLYTLNVRSRKITRRFKFDLDGMFEPTWSPDGKKIAVAGLKDGWSDIYIVTLKNHHLTRITHDPYDEKNLRWSPDGAWIAMSSDRPDTSLVYHGGLNFAYGHYGIYLIRPDGSEIRRISLSDGQDTDPSWGPNSRKLAFVSDRTGVGNIYLTDIDSTGAYPITNLLSSAQQIDWSPDGKKIVFSTFHRGGFDLFTLKDPLSPQKRIHTLPVTRLIKRLEGVNEKSFVERQQERQKEEIKADTTAAHKPSPSEPAKAGRKIERWISEQESQKVAPADTTAARAATDTTATHVAAGTTAARAGIDTTAARAATDTTATHVAADTTGTRAANDVTLNCWERQEWIRQQEEKADTSHTALAPPDTEDTVEPLTSPVEVPRTFALKKYRIHLRPEYFSANAGFDTFYGASGTVQLSLSDILGNHRLTIASNLSFSIMNSDIYVGYQYLAHRTNYGISLFHTPVFFFSGGAVNVDRYYGASFDIQRPFSQFSRVEASIQPIGIRREQLNASYNPYVGGGYLGGLTRGSGTVLANKGAVIVGGALVTDNTLDGLYGPVDGSRARLSFEGSGVGLKYATFQLDYRKYDLVLDRYTFAFRVAGGTSFGRNSTVFFLGGVNNPINPTYYTVASVNSNRLFFSSFLWPLRGVDLFQTAGNSFVLANVAFRFPIVQQLAMGWPLPFLFQNVEGTLFMDVGSAFNRGHFDPADVENGTLRLKDLKAGYGLGVRVNLGMFIFRYDLAWPTDLATTYSPKQYFSLDYTGLF